MFITACLRKWATFPPCLCCVRGRNLRTAFHKPTKRPIKQGSSGGAANWCIAFYIRTEHRRARSNLIPATPTSVRITAVPSLLCEENSREWQHWCAQASTKGRCVSTNNKQHQPLISINSKRTAIRINTNEFAQGPKRGQLRLHNTDFALAYFDYCYGKWGMTPVIPLPRLRIWGEWLCTSL